MTGDSTNQIQRARKAQRKPTTSCDACRLRKVKCVRSIAHSGVCDSCSKRYIACTQSLNDATRWLRGDPDHPDDHLNALDRPAELAALVSAQQRINEAVLSVKALCAFLFAYESQVAAFMPMLDYQRLLQSCKKASFRFTALQPLERIICLSAAALASSIQPEMQEIGTGQSTVVLKDPLATKRELERMIFDEVDLLGIVRKPSKDSLEALHLCSVLTSGDEVRSLRHSDDHRRYQQAMVEHVRALDERGDLSEALKSQYFYSAMVGDAFASALSGRPPAFTSEDMERFLPVMDLSTEGLLHSLDLLSSRPADFVFELTLARPDNGLSKLFVAIAQVCRTFYHRVTSTKARRRPLVDIEYMMDIPDEMERLTSIVEIFEHRCSGHTAMHAWPNNLSYWLKVGRLLCTFVMIMALDELDLAIQREEHGQISSLRLQALQLAHKKLERGTMRELREEEGWSPQNGVTRFLATIDGLMAFFTVLRMRRIFKCRSVEEGCPTSLWKLQDKLRVARHFMRTCEYFGVAVPAIKDELPDLRTKMSDLEMMADMITFTNAISSSDSSFPTIQEDSILRAALEEDWPDKQSARPVISLSVTPPPLQLQAMHMSTQIGIVTLPQIVFGGP